jgi:hypothetical protein
MREALWSAAACCRFFPGRFAGRAPDVVAVGTRASSLSKSGSKLPHSKALRAAIFKTGRQSLDPGCEKRLTKPARRQ